MPLASSTPIRTTPDQADDERPRVLVVDVDGARCALPVEWVREVIRPRAITVIPGSPAVACGLVNVRGMVVTVLDLAEALRMERVGERRGERRGERMGERMGEHAATAEGSRPVRAVPVTSVVLLEHGGRVIGVAVDAVHDVRPLDGVHTSAGTAGQAGAGATGTDVGARIACGPASAGDEIVTRLDPGVLLARVMLSSEEGP
jgi:purine-binding chemotaxis protein CheW